MTVSGCGRGLAFVALSLGLAACASAPAYQAREGGVGYDQTQIEERRYRVTYAGRIGQRREIVEDGLLLRAAEITLGAGGDRFVFATRDVETEVRRRPSALGCGWPYYRRGPFCGPFGPYYGGRTERRYVAYGEIVVLEPGSPASGVEVFDAADVRNRLGPVLRPPPKTAPETAPEAAPESAPETAPETAPS